VTAPQLREDPEREIGQLDQTLAVLGGRLQRILTALALTLEARSAFAERLAQTSGREAPEWVDVALLEATAARCREIVRTLASG
jgi:hypothetical protein